MADFGLARDLTECEYYRKTGDGKVKIMKAIVLTTFITLIQSHEWKTCWKLSSFPSFQSSGWVLRAFSKGLRTLCQVRQTLQTQLHLIAILAILLLAIDVSLKISMKKMSLIMDLEEAVKSILITRKMTQRCASLARLHYLNYLCYFYYFTYYSDCLYYVY